MRLGSVLGLLYRREHRGQRVVSFGSDEYWSDYRLSHRSVGTSGAFNWKHEHGTLLAVGSRDAYALNIVSLEKAPSSASVWSTWAPWKRDAEASLSRGLCEPHVLAVEANAHTNWITDIKFSHDDSEVLSASDDGTVVVYDVQRGKKKTSLELPGALMARSVCVSSQERDMVFVAADRMVYVWDRRTKVSGQSLDAHQGRVTDVECTTDCKVLWSASMDGTLRSWDRRRGISLTSLGGRAAPLTSVCLDKTESRLLVSSERGPVYLLDLHASLHHLQGASLAAVPGVQTFIGHSNKHYVKRARFSPCGNYVLCGSDDKRAYVWNINSGQSHTFEVPDARLASLVDAAFSNDSRQMLVAVGAEEGIFVWSPALIAQPTAEATEGARSSAKTAVQPYEIKFTVEGGIPVDDDFVEVNDNAEEEEEEELEQELADLVREPGVCTYDKGYGTMHVFVCRTCSLSSDPHTSAGMCYECTVDCHAAHDTVSLGKKRNFRCDCGTDKYFGTPCLLRGGKQSNDRNVYTHNFDLLYCFCNQPDDGQLMLQCFECLEWYHHGCLGIQNQETMTTGMDFLCDGCIGSRYSFLGEYSPAQLSTRQAGATTQPAGQLGYTVTGGRFLLPDWRTSLKPQHAKLAEDEPVGTEPAPIAPAAAAPVATAALLAALPPAPLVEPRTKEELDAEARRLILAGDRQGARNLVMRAMLFNMYSVSHRPTVTVQDVTRAAQQIQAAPASMAIGNVELPTEGSAIAAVPVATLPAAAAAPSVAVNEHQHGEKRHLEDKDTKGAPGGDGATTKHVVADGRPSKVARVPSPVAAASPPSLPAAPAPALASASVLRSSAPVLALAPTALRTSSEAKLTSPVSKEAVANPAKEERVAEIRQEALVPNEMTKETDEVDLPTDMDAAPEEVEEQVEPVRMDSEAEAVQSKVVVLTQVPEPEEVMPDAAKEEEVRVEEPEEAMPQATELDVGAASIIGTSATTVTSAVLGASTASSATSGGQVASAVESVEAMLGVADDMERRLAELDGGGGS